ncbi:MAG TPA: hypothetical protein VFO01_15540 [Trebonia sp.]|nr:hypothetical protein [Trebonia sp.]
MARRAARLLGPLGRRLFTAFILVGVGAVALLAVLAIASVRGQTSGLLASQQEQARQDIAAAIADAYARAGSWAGIDLTGAQALAQSTGAQLVILNVAGGRVATVTPASGQHGEQDHQQPTRNAPTRNAPTRGTGSHGTGGHGQRAVRPSGTQRMGDSAAPAGVATAGAFLAAATLSPTATAPAASPSASASPPASADQVPIVVNGKTVGTVIITFPPASQSAAWQARDAILRAVGYGSLAAVALAAVAALLVSWRTVRPLTALAAAADAVRRGDPDAAEAALRHHLQMVLSGLPAIHDEHPDYFEKET